MDDVVDADGGELGLAEAEHLYFVFCILYFVFCILYFVFCILYFVFCILYFVFCASVMDIGCWFRNILWLGIIKYFIKNLPFTLPILVC